MYCSRRYIIYTPCNPSAQLFFSDCVSATLYNYIYKSWFIRKCESLRSVSLLRKRERDATRSFGKSATAAAANKVARRRHTLARRAAHAHIYTYTRQKRIWRERYSIRRLGSRVASSSSRSVSCWLAPDFFFFSFREERWLTCESRGVDVCVTTRLSFALRTDNGQERI